MKGNIPVHRQQSAKTVTDLSSQAEGIRPTPPRASGRSTNVIAPAYECTTTPMHPPHSTCSSTPDQTTASIQTEAPADKSRLSQPADAGDEYGRCERQTTSPRVHPVGGISDFRKQAATSHLRKFELGNRVEQQQSKSQPQHQPPLPTREEHETPSDALEPSASESCAGRKRPREEEKSSEPPHPDPVAERHSSSVPANYCPPEDPKPSPPKTTSGNCVALASRRIREKFLALRARKCAPQVPPINNNQLNTTISLPDQRLTEAASATAAAIASASKRIRAALQSRKDRNRKRPREDSEAVGVPAANTEDDTPQHSDEDKSRSPSPREPVTATMDNDPTRQRHDRALAECRQDPSTAQISTDRTNTGTDVEPLNDSAQQVPARSPPSSHADDANQPRPNSPSPSPPSDQHRAATAPVCPDQQQPAQHPEPARPPSPGCQHPHLAPSPPGVPCPRTLRSPPADRPTEWQPTVPEAAAVAAAVPAPAPDRMQIYADPPLVTPAPRLIQQQYCQPAAAAAAAAILPASTSQRPLWQPAFILPQQEQHPAPQATVSRQPNSATHSSRSLATPVAARSASRKADRPSSRAKVAVRRDTKPRQDVNSLASEPAASTQEPPVSAEAPPQSQLALCPSREPTPDARPPPQPRQPTPPAPAPIQPTQELALLAEQLVTIDAVRLAEAGGPTGYTPGRHMDESSLLAIAMAIDDIFGELFPAHPTVKVLPASAYQDNLHCGFALHPGYDVYLLIGHTDNPEHWFSFWNYACTPAHFQHSESLRSASLTGVEPRHIAATRDAIRASIPTATFEHVDGVLMMEEPALTCGWAALNNLTALLSDNVVSDSTHLSPTAFDLETFRDVRFVAAAAATAAAAAAAAPPPLVVQENRPVQPVEESEVQAEEPQSRKTQRGPAPQAGKMPRGNSKKPRLESRHIQTEPWPKLPGCRETAPPPPVSTSRPTAPEPTEPVLSSSRGDTQPRFVKADAALRTQKKKKKVPRPLVQEQREEQRAEQAELEERLEGNPWSEDFYPDAFDAPPLPTRRPYDVRLATYNIHGMVDLTRLISIARQAIRLGDGTIMALQDTLTSTGFDNWTYTLPAADTNAPPSKSKQSTNTEAACEEAEEPDEEHDTPFDNLQDELERMSALSESVSFPSTDSSKSSAAKAKSSRLAKHLAPEKDPAKLQVTLFSTECLVGERTAAGGCGRVGGVGFLFVHQIGTPPLITKVHRDLWDHRVCAIDVMLQGAAPLRLLSVYAPTAMNGKEQSQLFYNKIEKMLPKTSRRVFILGDFNADLYRTPPNWIGAGNNTGATENPRHAWERFREFVYGSGLHATPQARPGRPTPPTFVDLNQRRLKTYDYILCSKDRRPTISCVREAFPLSDHAMVSADFYIGRYLKNRPKYVPRLAKPKGVIPMADDTRPERHTDAYHAKAAKLVGTAPAKNAIPRPDRVLLDAATTALLDEKFKAQLTYRRAGVAAVAAQLIPDPSIRAEREAHQAECKAKYRELSKELAAAVKEIRTKNFDAFIEKIVDAAHAADSRTFFQGINRATKTPQRSVAQPQEVANVMFERLGQPPEPPTGFTAEERRKIADEIIADAATIPQGTRPLTLRIHWPDPKNPARPPDLSTLVSPNSTLIGFTDGSLNDQHTTEPKAGAGICIIFPLRKTCPRAEDPAYRIPGRQEINRAELYAILRLLMQADDGDAVYAYVDSEVTMYRLDSILAASASHFAVEDGDLLARILHEMVTRSLALYVFKVKSHTGIDGNDRADEAANRGCQLPAVPDDLHGPVPPPALVKVDDEAPTRDQVVKGMLKVKPKAAGPDMVSAHGFRQAALRYRKKSYSKEEAEAGLPEADTEMIDSIVCLLQEVHTTHIAPRAWQRGSCVCLPKVSAATAAQHRPIILLSHLMKIYTAVFGYRTYAIQHDPAQFGFRPARGTAEAIAVLETVIDHHARVGKDLFAVFIDSSKAFDSPPRDIMRDILRARGVGEDTILTMADIYDERINIIGDGLRRFVETVTGNRQGCNASPPIFNIITDSVVHLARRTFRKLNIRITHPDGTAEPFDFCILIYADDICLLADSIDDLQHNTDILVRLLAGVGLKVNLDKTEWMQWPAIPKQQLTKDGFLANQKKNNISKREANRPTLDALPAKIPVHFGLDDSPPLDIGIDHPRHRPPVPGENGPKVFIVMPPNGGKWVDGKLKRILDGSQTSWKVLCPVIGCNYTTTFGASLQLHLSQAHRIGSREVTHERQDRKPTHAHVPISGHFSLVVGMVCPICNAHMTQRSFPAHVKKCTAQNPNPPPHNRRSVQCPTCSRHILPTADHSAWCLGPPGASLPPGVPGSISGNPIPEPIQRPTERRDAAGTKVVGDIFIYGSKIKQVDNFRYLGHRVENKRFAHGDFDRRFDLAHVKAKSLYVFLRHKKIPTRFRLQVYNAYVSSILLFGSETWNLGVRQKQRMNSFHTRNLRMITGRQPQAVMVDGKETVRYPSNKSVYRAAGRNVVPMSEMWDRRRAKYYAKVEKRSPILPEKAALMVEVPTSTTRLSYPVWFRSAAKAAAQMAEKEKEANRLAALRNRERADNV